MRSETASTISSQNTLEKMCLELECSGSRFFDENSIPTFSLPFLTPVIVKQLRKKGNIFSVHQNFTEIGYFCQVFSLQCCKKNAYFGVFAVELILIIS